MAPTVKKVAKPTKAVKKQTAPTDAADPPQRWQFTAGRFVYQEHLDFQIVLDHFGDKIHRYSMAHEEGEHKHLDCFIEFHSKQDWLSMEPAWLMVNGEAVKPHFTANTSRGAGYRTSCDCGHFYNQCEGKIGNGETRTNWYPCHDYVVKTQWVQTLWQKGKLEDPVRCAGLYKCLTPNLEAMYSRSEAQKVLVARDNFNMDYDEAIQATLVPFRELGRDIEAIRIWHDQYKQYLHRFYGLWLWGDSLIGKTKWINNFLPNAFWHDSGVNWKGYDPNEHTAIIFDDVPKMCNIIMDNKKLFQASGKVSWGLSATNCYAITLDVRAKAMVVLVNFPPNVDGWIAKNFRVVHVADPMFGEMPAAIEPSFAAPSCVS